MSFPWAKHYEPQGAFMKYVDSRLPIPRLVYDSLGAGYPVPKNLNYFYNFGVLAGVALVIQILTGVILGMHYAANTTIAFDSVEHIMRDVNGGWMLRYMHATGASFFFVVVYVHIGRGLYYGSYKPPREVLWLLGLVIFLLMMATAFMGYVLVWGQMSFWGATVITNLFSAIPLVGETIHTWLLGGFAPDNATLNRFFSLHYLLPFIILGVVILHVWALHIPGSNNPTGIDVKSEADTVPFHPYYTAKDFFGLGVYLTLFCVVVFFLPNMLGEPDNYIPANPLSTPAHIVPEWYFWPFYAILRAFTQDFLFIPAKLWGVLGMFSAILMFFFLPWLDTSPVRSNNYRPLMKQLFWIFVVDILVLGVCGGKPAGEPWLRISQIASAYYFIHWLILVPIVSRIEKPLPLPNSISEAVLKKQTNTGAPIALQPKGAGIAELPASGQPAE
ncbi:cytochrome b [Glacieibacterium megasporae]|uniref:cytochrome b n=1 Tax=Glacieibacterium megasporae TaxID=2835787 RepID=UPI001C1E02EA|nr:cytochrome b N-terminal domain-containing protein [Polymorphobacter megasporae]UAJ10401.1 cytochrome b N-terminal domain-containing protein [Polymorphobacter megasporae]